MPSVLRLLIAATLVALLTACPGPVRPDLPEGPGVAPEIVVVERKVYVEIPAHLTAELPVAEGPIAQCFSVAASRRAAIVTGNAQLREIAGIQGTAVPAQEPAP